MKIRGDKSDGYGADAWVFFSRVASQNKEFRPEVLPMLTPEIRRIAVLLRSIPQDGFINVTMRTVGGREDLLRCKLTDVNEAQNSVALTFRNSGGAEIARTIPLDHVRTVFRRVDGVWSADVDHFFMVHG